MSGATLWPLKGLAEIDPAAHATHELKYDGRPGLVDRPVEALGCTWADCVFSCPVDPRRLMRAARIARPNLPARDWFVIDADQLDVDNTVLYEPARWSPAARPPR